MKTRTPAPRQSLTALLDTLHPGDPIELTVVSRETGLNASTCVMVFEALTRAGLFTRTSEEVFTRRQLYDALNCGHL